MIEFLKLLLLFALLIVFSAGANIIGGLLSLGIALMIRIPYLGKIFNFLFNDAIKLTSAFKFFGFVISSSGLLLGLYVYYLIFGMPNGYYQSWVLLVCSSAVIINFFHGVMNLETMNFRDMISMASHYSEKIYGGDIVRAVYSDNGIKRQLIYSAIVSMYLPQLFRMLSSIGLFYYAMSQLKFITLKANITMLPSLYDCLKYSFSLLPIVKLDNSEYPFIGFTWDVFSIFFGVVILVWTVFFITTAQTNAIQQLEELLQEYTSEQNEENQQNSINLQGQTQNIISDINNKLGKIESKLFSNKENEKKK